MFTGIVEETGKINSFCRLSNGAEIEIVCDKVLEDTKIGDSICVNGVCQTVTELNSKSFKAKLSDETLRVTSFDGIKSGDMVNLERALTLNTRLGGHIVSGHVDGIAKLLSVVRQTDFYAMRFELPYKLVKYVVKKGSITINGISLTVAEITGNTFSVAVIPHTFENTNLKYLKIGDSINVETDILAKYVEKLLSSGDNSSKISMELLSENGFV